jgi:hypothetical protein
VSHGLEFQENPIRSLRKRRNATRYRSQKSTFRHTILLVSTILNIGVYCVGGSWRILRLLWWLEHCLEDSSTRTRIAHTRLTVHSPTKYSSRVRVSIDVAKLISFTPTGTRGNSK